MNDLLRNAVQFDTHAILNRLWDAMESEVEKIAFEYNAEITRMYKAVMSAESLEQAQERVR